MADIQVVDGSEEGDIIYEAVKMTSIDGQGALLDCIEDNVRRPGVVWRGMVELGAFVMTDETRRDCIELGGLDLVCTCLSNFAADGDVQRHTSRILARLCAGGAAFEDARAAAAENGALTAIVGALKRHRSDVETIENCVGLMALMVKQAGRSTAPADRAAALLSAGVFEPLLLVLEQHTELKSHRIMHAVLQTLSLLAYHVPDARALVGDRALEAVVDAWQALPRKPELETAGRAVIRSIKLPALVRAAGVYLARADVTAPILSAFHLFAQTDGARRIFVEAGGVPATLDAMRAWPRDAPVVHFGLRVVADVALCGSPMAVTPETDLKLVLRGAGAIELVVAGVGALPGALAVQRQGMLALSNLSYNPLCARQIVEDGGIGEIVGVLQRLVDDRDICDYAASAISNIGVSRARHRALLAEGGAVVALAAMMRRHKTRENLQILGAWALASVVWARKQVQEHAVDTGAEQACRDAFWSFPRPLETYNQRLATSTFAPGRPGDVTLAAFPGNPAHRLRTFDARRDVYVLDMLGATALVQSDGVKLSPVQLAAATALRQMCMPAAGEQTDADHRTVDAEVWSVDKATVPYTPYGGFEVDRWAEKKEAPADADAEGAAAAKPGAGRVARK